MLFIKEFMGYKIYYDERKQKFQLENQEGDIVAERDTQAQAEDQAKMLSKQGFKRIKVLRIHDNGVVQLGELTSMNRDDRSAWVITDRRYGKDRQKIHLGSNYGYHEVTEENLAIAEQAKKKCEQIEALTAEIKELKAGLEKRIDLDYFGLSRGY